MKVNINVCKNGNQYILPLSLQILLENAIKHNIVSNDEPLEIDIIDEKDYLVIRNKLNAKRNKQERTEIGLENIKMRYKYLTQKPVEVLKTEVDFTVKLPILIETK